MNYNLALLYLNWKGWPTAGGSNIIARTVLTQMTFFSARVVKYTALRYDVSDDPFGLYIPQTPNEYSTLAYL